MTHYTNSTNEKPGRFYGQYLLGDTMELTDGSIWEYHPEVGWFPTRIGTVRGITDPLIGGIGYLIGPDGKADPFAKKVRRGNIFTKSIGGRYGAVNNAANKTSSYQMVLATHFDRVRLILPNIDTVPHTNIKVSVAPSSTSAATQLVEMINPTGSWVDGTFASVATGTLAASDGVTPTFTVTDWIDVTSVDRSDGGTLPVLAIRIESPAANLKQTAMFASTYDSFANRASVGDRTYRASLQSVLGVTTKGLVTGYGWSDFTQAVIVQYQSRVDGVTVAAFGDSITEGAVSPIAGYNWVFQSGVAAHSTQCPVEVANFGWGTKDSNEFYELAALLLPTVKPSVSWFAAFTPNLSLISANIDTMRRYTSRFRGLCADYGVQPILWTGLPTTSGASQGKVWGAADALRIAYNAELATYGLPLADFSAVVTGGTSVPSPPQIDLLSGTSDDGLHPNALGDTTLTVPALALLNSLGLTA